MNIRIYPDPVLRQKAKPVSKITPEIQRTFKEMAAAMYVAQGVGLAAPQVGISKQLIILDVGQGLVCLANPRIVKRSGTSKLEEGCLSFPGISVTVKRSAHVVVEAVDENDNSITVIGKGLLAHVLQHEIDHLHGKVIIDYAGLKDKWRLRKKLKEFQARHADAQSPVCSVKTKCI